MNQFINFNSYINSIWGPVNRILIHLFELSNKGHQKNENVWHK